MDKDIADIGMFLTKFCDIYDVALVGLTLVCAYMIFKDGEKNTLSKLLILIDLLLVIRTLTITKLLKKGVNGEDNCQPTKKKKQKVIILEEEDDDTEDNNDHRSYLASKVGAKN